MQLDGIGPAEATAILTEYSTPEALYNVSEDDLEQPWIPYDSVDKLRTGLESINVEPPQTSQEQLHDDRSVPDEIELYGDTYTFLGETATGLLQYYRVNEDAATVALLEPDDDGGYVDRQPIHLDRGEPWDALQQYAYNQSWKRREEISRANRDVPPPIHDPETNTALDGSIVLDDHFFPVRAEMDTVHAILEDQADDADAFIEDYRPNYLEAVPHGTDTKYRIVPEVIGPQLQYEKPDRVLTMTKDSEERTGLWQVDELVKDYYAGLLEEVVEDRSLVKELLDEYPNPRTWTWATTSDVTYLENTWGQDAHELKEKLQDSEHDIHRGPRHPAAGKLYVPDRKKDDADECSDELNTQQAGFDQFD